MPEMFRRPVLGFLLAGFLLAAAILAGVLPASATDKDLESLLMSRGEAFVAAMNRSDDDGLVAFAERHVESRVAAGGLTSRFVDSARRDFAEQGRIVAHQVKVLSDGQLVFVYAKREKTGVWQSFQFRVLAQDDHRLQLFFISIAVEPIARPSTPIEAPETRRWLDAYLARVEEQQPFSGVLVIQKGGEDLYAVVRGLADAEAKTPMARTTRLNTASGSKMFTAVAILQLAQSGKLSLDDTLARHLPAFPDRDYAAKVTLRQLLSHSGGAGNYWTEEYEAHWHEITETRQLEPFVLANLDPSAIGRFAYSNSGFILLGMVIEAVSGTSYYDHVDAHIFRPAGMRSTGFPLRSKPEAGVAGAYRPRWQAGAVEPGVYLAAELGERGSAAGGASTTADDMLAFIGALRDGTLLDGEHYQAMITPQVPFEANSDTWYGLGTIIKRHRGTVSFGHGGMGPGTQFELEVYPDRDLVFVALSNFDTVATHEVTQAIDDLVRGAD